MAVYRPIEITILGFVSMTPGGAVQIILVLIMWYNNVRSSR